MRQRIPTQRAFRGAFSVECHVVHLVPEQRASRAVGTTVMHVAHREALADARLSCGSRLARSRRQRATLPLPHPPPLTYAGRTTTSGRGGLAQPVERLADEPGDVHLGAAHALADLPLRELLLVAQAEDLALAVRQ